MAGNNPYLNILAELDGIIPKAGPVTTLDDIRNPGAAYDNSWVQSYAPNTASAGVQQQLNNINKAGAPSTGHFWSDLWNSFSNSGVGHFVTDTLPTNLDRAGAGVRNATFEAIKNIPMWGLNMAAPAIGAANGAGPQAFTQAVNTPTQGESHPIDAFLQGIADPHKAATGRDIFNKSMFGNTNADVPYLSGIGGFGAAVAADPLTYLTFGAGSANAAIKAGKAVGEAKAAAQGLHLASDAAKSIIDDSIKTAVAKANNRLVGFAGQTVVPKFGGLRVGSQTIGAQPAIDLASKFHELGLSNDQAAQAVSQMLKKDIPNLTHLNTQEYDFVNNLVDKAKLNGVTPGATREVPNTFDFQHMNGPATSYRQVNPDLRNLQAAAEAAKQSPEFAQVFKAASNMENVTIKAVQEATGLPKTVVNQALADLEKYGIVSPSQAFKGRTGNLDSLIGRATGPVKTTFEDIANASNPSRVFGVPINMPKTVNRSAIPDKINKGKITKIEHVPVDSVDNIVDYSKNAGNAYKYYEGLDGMSKLGKAVGTNKVVAGAGKMLGSRRFVDTASKLADHRLEVGTGAVLDANNKGFAYAKQAVDKIGKLAKSSEMKALTPEEQKMIPFVMEGKWPESMANSMPAADRLAKIQAAADKFTAFRDEMTKLEQAAGVQYGTKENYFPHMYNFAHDKPFSDILHEIAAVDPTLASKLSNGPKGFTKQRKAFNNMADLHDALQSNPALKDIFGNASFNPLEAFGQRAIQGAHAMAKSEAYNAVKDMGLMKSVEKGIPKGWKAIGDAIPELKGMAVPEKIHKEFTAVGKLLTNSKELNKTFDKVEEVMNVWRRNVTVVKAGFHIRQVFGNAFQNTLAGVTPKAWGTAIKVLANPDKHADIVNEAISNGIMHLGGSAADLSTTLGKELGGNVDKANILQKLNPLGQHYILGTAGRKAGEYEDNVARLAHYLHMRSEGMTAKQSADSVRKYLFNYSEINDVGRGIRQVMPFYQWMRNNLPFQAVYMLKNPGKYTYINEALTQMQGQDGSGIDGALTKLGINEPGTRDMVQKLIKMNGGTLPDYVKQGYLKIPGTADKFFNMSLPITDLQKLGADPANYALQSLNPFIGLPFQLAGNKDGLGIPINKDGNNVDLPTALDYILGQTVPGIYQPGVAAAGRNIVGDKKDRTGELLKSFGVKPYTQDVAKEIQNIIYDSGNSAAAKLKRDKRQAK